MEQVGVELIVEGLAAFTSDMSKAKSVLVDMVPGGNLVSNMFSSLGDIISGFVGGALRVLEFTLGNLIADAIEAVIDSLKRLVSQTIQAGSEFQTLSIRLNGLNLQDAIDSGKSYETAIKQAVSVTKEQLNWLQQLSAATPFDATAIANAYTLARSYGFVDDEARKLTKDITDFTAGMGLSNDHIERVITNLGQMVQRGKVTSTEMRDLARGAFLPLDDVLKRMAANMGVSEQALTKMISTAEGVDPNEFIKAFEQMVEEEPRFIGAAGRLGRTFEAAKNNVLDMVRSIGGLNIIKPILDVLGEHVASLVDQFVSFNAQGELIHTEKWDKLVDAAGNLGKALSGVLDELLGMLPSSEGFADGVISGLNRVSDWLTSHKGDIVAWVRSAAQWINSTLVPAIISLKNWLFGINNPSGTMQQKGALQTLAEGAEVASRWIGETLIPFIQNALLPALAALWPLAVAIGEVLITAFTGAGHDIRNLDFTDWITNTLIPAIKDLTKWIDKNRSLLATLARGFAIVWAIAIVGATILGTLISVMAGLVGIFAGVASAIIVVLGGALIAFGALLVQVIAKIIVWRLQMAQHFKEAFNRVATIVGDWEARMFTSFVGWVNSVIDVINNIANVEIPTIVIPVTYEVKSSIPNGVPSCFVAGTLVTMDEETQKPIEEIEIGDVVLSFDTKEKLPIFATVEQIFHHPPEDAPFYLLINNIGVTPNHLLFVNGRWQEAGSVMIGDTLMDKTGQEVRVDSVEYIYESVPTYDIHVGHVTHNYFANGVLVHNKYASGTGGWMTVPPGYEKDNYPIFAKSGERFAVVPPGESMPATPASNTVNATQQIINYFNLNIHSSAPTEPIIQDFGLMQSMVGSKS